MAEPLAAAVLGVVEGVTEFLPISSTGHLIVAADLLQFDSAAAFEIIIQLGAVIAVVWFYHRQLLEQARQLPHERDVQRFWLGVVLAFIPAAVVGLLLGDYIERVLFRPRSSPCHLSSAAWCCGSSSRFRGNPSRKMRRG